MLRFEGDREFTISAAAVLAQLTDVPFLVACIPDVEQVRATDADRADLVLRPGFAFVRGTLDVAMHIAERAADRVRYQLLSKGIGSSSEVEANLAIADTPTGSHVHWIAEVKSLGGLLKMVPAGLIRGAAEKVINDAWDRIGQKLGS